MPRTDAIREGLAVPCRRRRKPSAAWRAKRRVSPS